MYIPICRFHILFVNILRLPQVAGTGDVSTSSYSTIAAQVRTEYGLVSEKQRYMHESLQ